MQLARAHVHGEDAPGPAPQAHLGEAAGRGPDVQHHPSLHRHRPMRQRMIQLQGPPPHEIMRLDHIQHRIGPDLLGCGDRRHAVDGHPAGLDCRPGPRASGDKAARDQQGVHPHHAPLFMRRTHPSKAASLALLTGGGRKDSLIADAPVRAQNFA